MLTTLAAAPGCFADIPGFAEPPDGSAGDGGGDADSGPDAGPDPSLVGWWRFDEGSGTVAKDGSANGNDGTLTTGTAWTEGKIDGALQFAGGIAFVEDAPSLHALADEMTVALWMNVDALGDAEHNQERFLQFAGTWELKLNGGSPQLSTSPRYAIIDWTTPVGEWHHIAFRFDHGSVEGFIDGEIQTTGNNSFEGTDPIPVGTEGVAIGGVLPDSVEDSSKCRLDDLRIYERALSTDEIAELAK